MAGADHRCSYALVGAYTRTEGMARLAHEADTGSSLMKSIVREISYVSFANQLVNTAAETEPEGRISD